MVMAVSLLLLIVGSSAERDFEVTLDDITRNQQRNFDGGFHPGGDGAKAQKAAGSFFEGNISSSQHFALLSAQPGSLLVGGRGVVYNLSLPGLHEIREERIEWECTEEAEQLCLLKGRSATECGNFARVHAFLGDNTILICGTHCFSPLCRHYKGEPGGGHSLVREFSGRGHAPFHPDHNSSYLYTRGSLYAATVADFSATDSLIIKNQLRTEQYDYMHLNSPDFVGSLEDDDHVYFFFREAAVEFMNCGKAMYSRVARVCKNDEGGSHKFANRWTTFLKARLNCSLPGDYPFYFDNIQSTSGWHREDGKRVFYAVFTTPTNAIPGSAICRFSLDDLTASFEGDFKQQATVNSNWLPLGGAAVPNPRPGRCHNSSSTLPESSLHFIKNHCLMDRAVASSPASPVFLRTGDSELLTRLVIQPGVRDLAGVARDLFYVGTNRGRVLRIATDRAGLGEVLEEIQVFPSSTPVLDLVLPSLSSPLLLVVSADRVHSLPLVRCNHTSCAQCLAPAASPHCAWHQALATCAAHRDVADKTRMTQSLEACPVEGGESTHVSSTPKSTTSTTSPKHLTTSPASPACPSCTCNPCTPASPLLKSTSSRAGELLQSRLCTLHVTLANQPVTQQSLAQAKKREAVGRNWSKTRLLLLPWF